MTDARERLNSALASIRFETSGKPGTMSVASSIRATYQALEALAELVQRPALSPEQASVINMMIPIGPGSRNTGLRRPSKRPDTEVVREPLDASDVAAFEELAAKHADVPLLNVEPVSIENARQALSHLVHGTPLPYEDFDAESALLTYIETANTFWLQRAEKAEREVEQIKAKLNEERGLHNATLKEFAAYKGAAKKLIAAVRIETASIFGTNRDVAEAALALEKMS